MAVYTALDDDALRVWLAHHAVGTLVVWRGIPSGIENSNFFVTTRDGGGERHFVLTLFERLGAGELSYYLGLMRHLALAGMPCPAPMPDRAGALHSSLCGKPAALVTRLDGRSVERPSAAHCAAIGATLARLHLAGARFDGHQTNPRGIDWWLATSGAVREYLDEAQRTLLDEETELQASHWTETTRSLPRGAIHADLFRDNALFVDGPDAAGAAAAVPALRGVIDFYFAGDDTWVLDIAICLNDWCVDLESGVLDAARVDALLSAYAAERPLGRAECEALPQVLRAAALRFWLSRLHDLHRPRPAQMLTPHDPTRFERLLRHRRDEMRSRHSTYHRFSKEH